MKSYFVWYGAIYTTPVPGPNCIDRYIKHGEDLIINPEIIEICLKPSINEILLQ